MRASPLDAVRTQFGGFRAVFAIPAFATFQAGNFLMTTGFWMQRIAVGWVTWELTKSEYWLGLVAFAELFPSIITAVYGGALVDRHPATRIMFWGQIASAAVASIMAFLSVAGLLTELWIVVVMVLLGAVSGLVLPARLVMASHLAPKELLPQAIAVNSTGFNLARFIGPMLAAGLLVAGSASIVFFVAALGFLVLAFALYRIRNVPPQTRRISNRTISTWSVLKEMPQVPVIACVILIQAAQGLFLRPASELFPAFSELVFDLGADGLGFMNAALGIGAIIGALALSKQRENADALGQILLMSSLFAITLLAFSVTSVFWLALVFLVCHGAAMSASNIAALAYVQIEAPPERLGRILSFYTIVFRVGPATGALIFGITAEITGLLATGLMFGLVGLFATIVLGALIFKLSEKTS
ncbi:MAG: MFS transporter [Pseudomonadota bacterium]